MEIVIEIIAFIWLPLILLSVDAFIGFRSKGKKYKFKDTHHKDFTVLVPIYGQIKYLENVDYLSQYKSQVMLLTTGGESEEFMSQIKKIASKHKFQIFVAAWSQKQNLKKRSTSGTIRDRLIRDALSKVKTKYVVPLDADSVTVENISLAVGELVAEKGDIASIKLVPSNGDKNWLTKLQKLEYRMSMDMRHIVPWLISGACQVSKTKVMVEIMNRHSLFFQGNDVEIGLIAKSMGYKVVHIPFEVHTALPEKLKPWIRQRLAWAGGEFRLFIVNIRYIFQHPFFWFYGAVIVIAAFPLRYFSIASHSVSLAIILVIYVLMVYAIHWRNKNAWLIIMPAYLLFSSIFLVPIGIYMYLYMAVKDNNFGFISRRVKSVS